MTREWRERDELLIERMKRDIGMERSCDAKRSCGHDTRMVIGYWPGVMTWGPRRKGQDKTDLVPKAPREPHESPRKPIEAMRHQCTGGVTVWTRERGHKRESPVAKGS